MSILGNDLLLGSGDEGYNLTRSLRTRASATGYLSRTPASAGDRQKWTFSTWVKRSNIGAEGELIGTSTGTTDAQTFEFFFGSDNKLTVGQWNITLLATSAVYRDPAAWYHAILVLDTTQATASNRLRMYVNGSEVTSFSTDTRSANIAQNANMPFNTALLHSIGAMNYSFVPTFGRQFDGYFAETYFIDGQALTPSSFGSTNTLTGVWQPAPYTGTYGTNGFYLPFTDNSALTTSSNAGLGKDFSGNGNYWTTNNISITSGTTYDSMTDVPTLTSPTAANFAVMNVLNGNPATGSLSDGNLTGLSSSAGEGYWNSTIAIPSSGKWYWEFQFTTGGSGIRTAVTTTSMGTYSLLLNEAGRLYVNGADQGIVASSYSSTDVMGVSVDVSTTTIKWYKNSTLNYTYTYTAQSLPLFAFGGKYSNPCYFNFGQRPFSYTPPTGFVALNTYNLPTSTIVKGNTVMDATLWTGNGTTQSITNAAGFKPDFVWIKNRNNVRWHILTDSVRGNNKQSFSNDTAAEESRTDRITAFNSNGFSVGSYTDVNLNADTFVGWQWQAGQGTTSTNTSGSITSTVSVNASAGFSVVTYTGTGANATVGHGLGVAPQFIITKNRSATSAWHTYVAAIPNMQNGYIVLNSSAAFSTSTNTVWNGTQPTSSVFSVGTDAGTNGSGNAEIAYCWTPIAGYSSFGSYTGNGSADGPFVYLGFRPKFVLYKRVYSAGSWGILDSARNPNNPTGKYLYPNASDAEFNGDSSYPFDFLSNGFKIRHTGASENASGSLYIYAAFAENPFKNSLAE